MRPMPARGWPAARSSTWSRAACATAPPHSTPPRDRPSAIPIIRRRRRARSSTRLVLPLRGCASRLTTEAFSGGPVDPDCVVAAEAAAACARSSATTSSARRPPTTSPGWMRPTTSVFAINATANIRLRAGALGLTLDAGGFERVTWSTRRDRGPLQRHRLCPDAEPAARDQPPDPGVLRDLRHAADADAGRAAGRSSACST